MEQGQATAVNAQTILSILADKRPQFRNGFDAISLVLHIVMRKLGFTFAGCGEANDESDPDAVIPPAAWNQSADSFCFRYKHPRSSSTFVIKNLVMGETLLVNGMVTEEKNIYNFEVRTGEYVNTGVALGDYAHLFKDLDKLISQFKTYIVFKMFPYISEESQSFSQPRQQQHGWVDDPLRVGNEGNRGGPRPSPLLEGGPYGQPYQPPFGVGSGDLGPQLPGFPGMQPFGGPAGNLVGPHHPGFGPLVSDPYGNTPFGPGRGAGGADGRGRGIHGPRYDPYGPPRPGNQFGEPDNDNEPPPPGAGPNYDYFL